MSYEVVQLSFSFSSTGVAYNQSDRTIRIVALGTADVIA